MGNHSKLGKSGSMGLHGTLSLKMGTPMTEIDFRATFITKPNFPIRLLKNSLSFMEKLKLKKLKKFKKFKT